MIKEVLQEMENVKKLGCLLAPYIVQCARSVRILTGLLYFLCVVQTNKDVARASARWVQFAACR